MNATFSPSRHLPVVFAAGAALLAAGCASQRVTADYLMPARRVADVGAVSVLDIVCKASLSGNRVADGDSERAAALVRQNIASRLCQEGFYQTVDSIWGPDAKGAAALCRIARDTGSRHGYASFLSLAPDATGRLEVSFELAVDAERRRKREDITLTSVPYKECQVAGVPSSIPNPDPETHTKRTVAANYEVWSVSGTGALRVKLFDARNGKLVYERTFEIEAPDDDARSEPTILRAVAAAVDPAVREIVADISPHQESRQLVVNEEAHPRVVAFLAAKDYVDTVLEVERLEEAKAAAGPRDKDVYAPVVGDFENKAVALEVLGDFAGAGAAWKQALALQPGYGPAVDGVRRVDGVLAGGKAIRSSGARKAGSSEYKKDAVNKGAR